MSARINLAALESELYKQLKADPKSKNMVISPSYLRMEQPLVNGKNTFEFSVLNTGKESLTEKKLDKNDLFLAYKLGMFIFRRDTSTQDEAIQPLQTYPNETYFPAVAGYVPGHMEALYNGSLDLKRGTRVVMESFPTRGFREASDLQQSSASNKSANTADSGFVVLNPSFRIPGREQTKITLNIPPYSSLQWADATANKENRIAFVFIGFLIKGANI